MTTISGSAEREPGHLSDATAAQEFVNLAILSLHTTVPEDDREAQLAEFIEATKGDHGDRIAQNILDQYLNPAAFFGRAQGAFFTFDGIKVQVTKQLQEFSDLTDGDKNAYVSDLKKRAGIVD